MRAYLPEPWAPSGQLLGLDAAGRLSTDLAGAPAELTNPDGELAGRQLRTVWGGTIWSEGGAQTPLRFPGQYADPEAGLHYNQQRYYDIVELVPGGQAGAGGLIFEVDPSDSSPWAGPACTSLSRIFDSRTKWLISVGFVANALRERRRGYSVRSDEGDEARCGRCCTRTVRR